MDRYQQSIVTSKISIVHEPIIERLSYVVTGLERFEGVLVTAWAVISDKEIKISL